ncbi:MAG: GldG family protein [Cellvibrionaceae bacterium]
MTWSRISLYFKFLLPLVSATLLIIFINILSIKNPQRLDLTSTGVYSISEDTRFVIEKINNPVDIIFFYDLRSKAMQDAFALLKQYADASDYISVRAIDPQLQPAQARRYNIRFAGSSIFTSDDRQIIVNGGSETDFTNGLIRISLQAKKHICFTDGHIESDPFSLKSHDHLEQGDGLSSHDHSTGGRALEIHERHGMGMAKDALEVLGYTVSKVVLLQDQQPLNNCSVVIVASPQKKFHSQEVEQLRKYMASGGKAIIMLEPNVDSGLSELLSDYGIAIEQGTVIDSRRHYWTDPAAPAVTEYTRHAITRNLALTFFPGSTSLIPDDKGFGVASVIPLVSTSDNSLLELPDGSVSVRKGERALLVNSTKFHENDIKSHLIAIGDGDFATNSYFHILGNGTLFTNSVNVLAGEDQLLDIKPRNYELDVIRLSNNQMLFTFLSSTIFLPVALLFVGGFIWWRRKNSGYI